MSRLVNLAALQTHYGSDLQDNIDRTIVLIQRAAAAGVQPAGGAPSGGRR